MIDWQSYVDGSMPAAERLIAANEIERIKRILEETLAHHTGQPIERIATDTDRDFVMTANEAREYGISEERLRELRCTRIGMIFQEPMTSLNPVMRCGDQIDEVLRERQSVDTTGPIRAVGS